MTADLRGLPITFYGHFSGFSSYPSTCHAIARWLAYRGADLAVCNLRTEPVFPDLEDCAVEEGYAGAVWNRAAGSGVGGPMAPDREDAISLVSAFPSWLSAIPRHRRAVGRFVGDVQPLPPRWKGLIERHCDIVVTESGWCSTLLGELALTRGGQAIPVHVAPPGIDPEVFKPGQGGARGRAVRMLHFGSSPTGDRKGTLELVAAAREWLYANAAGGRPVHLIIRAHRDLLPLAASSAGSYAGGKITVMVDEPGTPEAMAHMVRSADVLVQPSRAEGFGLIPVQAVACGRPVILMGEPGDADYLDDLGAAAVRVKSAGWGACGGGVAPEIDLASLLGALQHARGHADGLKEVAGGIAQSVREKWSWGRVLDAYLAPVLTEASR
jgi:glycosyltransferase involved in cell wall biosynthesis